ncbi:MAG: sulfatase, partial [Halobacteriaceae archaeon]
VEAVDPDADGRDPEVAETIASNYRTYVTEIESCGFDDARSIFPRNVFGFELPESMEYHNMEWVTQGALDFIETHRDEPFFLFMAPTLPHDPWERDQLRADPRITPSGYLEEPPDVQPPREDVIERVENSERATREPDEAELAGFMTPEKVQVGRTFVSWLDDGIGAVLDRLDELGLAEDTLVIFTSDHGNRGKLTCYDGGARQPCIARWPGVITPGTTRQELVSNIDLVPTIFDIVGVGPPADYHIDGQSFVPLLTGEGDYERDSLFLEITTERAVVTDDGFKYIAVRYPPDIRAEIDDGAKYSHDCVERGENEPARFAADRDFPAYHDRDQLYDLEADPLEQTNLADDPAYRDRLAEMQDLLSVYSRDLPHEFGEFS